ncbi:hypothetical protein VTO42DRAFT_3318 [Malbranchea cinnamomea]
MCLARALLLPPSCTSKHAKCVVRTSGIPRCCFQVLGFGSSFRFTLPRFSSSHSSCLMVLFLFSCFYGQSNSLCSVLFFFSLCVCDFFFLVAQYSPSSQNYLPGSNEQEDAEIDKTGSLFNLLVLNIRLFLGQCSGSKPPLSRLQTRALATSIHGLLSDKRSVPGGRQTQWQGTQSTGDRG